MKKYNMTKKSFEKRPVGRERSKYAGCSLGVAVS